jgi:hypothetical protein
MAAKKKPIYEHLAEVGHMITNPEMARWAEKFDAGEHGAKAAAKHIRLNLSAVAKECKALRIMIQERKAKLL